MVTGSGAGIGRATAERFTRGGAAVAVFDLDQQAAADSAARIEAAGGRALALACDVTDYRQCQTATAKVLDAFGGIDVLINNAGITHLSAFSDTEPEALRRVMEVNFFGAVHCTKAALPSIVQRRGSVVAISSIAGVAPLALRCGYSASKHAVIGLFDTLRSELASQGVHVMVVCPGFTDTAIEDAALGGVGGRAVRKTVGKLAQPSEVAEAIYKGVRKGRRMLVLTPVGKLSFMMTRFLPALYERIMARQMI